MVIKTKQKVSKMKNKFCHICNQKVARNATQLDMPNLNENIRNEEYWYVHTKCLRDKLGTR